MNDLLFTGRSFCAGRNTIDWTPSDLSHIHIATIQNGVYDELHITKNVSENYTTAISNEWNYDTILHALFQGDLHAGNVHYTAEEVTCVRIKRRQTNTFEWITLYEVPIHIADDFKFERFDRYARSNVEYEYALVPVIDRIEGNLNVNTVFSEFDGIFICEKDLLFHTTMNVDIQAKKNRPAATIATINRRYPFVISNGNNNYYSGTASGTFMNVLDNQFCLYDYQNGWKYRSDMMEFLCNGRPKILKYDDGRMWLVQVVGTPTENTGQHETMPITSFDWTEIEDCESSHALFISGLGETDIEGR